MGKKCCKSTPPCKGCPKLRKKKKKGIAAVDSKNWPIFYLAPTEDISINGQRG